MDGIIALVEGGGGELVGTKRSLLGIIDLVEPQRYRQRSSLLCQHARLCKNLRRQQREDSNEFVGRFKRVRRQVETHNKRMAIRWADVITLQPEPGTRPKSDKRRKTQVEGRGKYKMYTGETIQRICFGRGWRCSGPPQSLNHKRPRKRRSALATSARGLADFFECASNYPGRLRDAVALGYHEAQKAAIASLRQGRVIILEISFDESEQDTVVDNVTGVFSMMMVHCRLHWISSSGQTLTIDVPLPPAFLQDTTAETLWKAILLRLPIAMQDLLKKTRVLVVAILSDSAASCVKLGKHVRSSSHLKTESEVVKGRASVHSCCMMHQVALVVSRLMKNTKVLCPMFCSCTLMQKGTNKMRVMTFSRNKMLKELKVVYEKPPEHNYLVRSLLLTFSFTWFALCYLRSVSYYFIFILLLASLSSLQGVEGTLRLARHTGRSRRRGPQAEGEETRGAGSRRPCSCGKLLGRPPPSNHGVAALLPSRMP